MEPRIIRPTKTPYLIISAFFGGIVVLYVALHVLRGPQTNAWQAMLIAAVVWAVLILTIRSRAVRLSANGLKFCGSEIPWENVSHSRIDYYHNTLMIFSEDSVLPVVQVPLTMYSAEDIEYLIKLERLSVR